MNTRFFQTLSCQFQLAENVNCGRISMELISWGLKFQPKPKRAGGTGRVEFDVCELFAYE